MGLLWMNMKSCLKSKMDYVQFVKSQKQKQINMEKLDFPLIIAMKAEKTEVFCV